MWSVSVACEDAPAGWSAVVHDPCTRRDLRGARGRGAALTERRADAARPRARPRRLSAPASAYSPRIARARRRCSPRPARVRDIRRGGSAATRPGVGRVRAAGRVLRVGHQRWDRAAGMLLVAEAAASCRSSSRAAGSMPASSPRRASCTTRARPRHRRDAARDATQIPARSWRPRDCPRFGAHACRAIRYTKPAAGVARLGPGSGSNRMTLGSGRSEAAAHRIEAWCGEPLFHEGEDIDVALAPGTAAVRHSTPPSTRWPAGWWSRATVAARLLARARARASALGSSAELASGTTLRRHQVDALAGQLAALIADLERSARGRGGRRRRAGERRRPREPPRRSGRGRGRTRTKTKKMRMRTTRTRTRTSRRIRTATSRRASITIRRWRCRPRPTRAGRQTPRRRPGRPPPLPLQAPDRVRQDHRRRRLRRGRPHHRRPHPHPSPAARRPVHARPHEGGLRRRACTTPSLLGDRTPRTPPLTINTYSWFIKHAYQLKPDVYGVVVCDEAHTALGEKTAAAIRRFDEPVYIGMTATDQLLQKHVGGRVPGRGGRLPAGRGRAPRRCRSAALHPRAPDRVAAHTSRSSAATSTRASWPPRSTSTRSTWPPPTSTRAASATPRASSTRPASTTPSAWPRRCGDRHACRRRLGPHAAARAGRDAGRLRARRDQRAGERDAAGRGLERAPRDRLHAPRAHRQPPRLPAARRAASCACTVARSRASWSTSPSRARPTPSAWSRCTRCSTSMPTGPAGWSRRRRRGAAAGAAGRPSRSSRKLPGSSPSPTTRSGGSR